MAGLFVETEELRDVDATIRLDFLVQEGQIRAKAVVRHVKPGSGLGLKFIALTEGDGPRLTALITRLRSLSYSNSNSNGLREAVRWSRSGGEDCRASR
jgi:hypothetical protein